MSKYKYEVSIKLRGKHASGKIFTGQVEWGTRTPRKTDLVIIGKNLISIECERIRPVCLKGVFDNYNSFVYNQISKALAFYMCSQQKAADIESIKIIEKKNDKKTGNKKLLTEGIQPRKFYSNFQGTFDVSLLQEIFLENPKSKSLFKAVTYFLRSKTKQDVFDRFESLWKGYNGLYKVIASQTNDFECHKALREFILKNPNATKNTQRKISAFTAQDIRNVMRWREFVLNDFETIKQAKSFHDFVLRYKDHRIMEVIEKILPYRISMLENLSPPLDGSVKTHINQQINAGYIDDAEVVALICIKYMYFVRNKSVHGERIDRIVGTDNKETKEVTWLCELLESLIIDLINGNSLY